MISSTISASMMMSETKMKEGDYRRKEKKNEKIYSLKKLRLAHRRKKNKLHDGKVNISPYFLFWKML